MAHSKDTAHDSIRNSTVQPCGEVLHLLIRQVRARRQSLLRDDKYSTLGFENVVGIAERRANELLKQRAANVDRLDPKPLLKSLTLELIQLGNRQRRSGHIAAA